MSAEKRNPKVQIHPVKFEDLKEVGIKPEQIALLSADDLITITHSILLHFNHDVFPYELRWQVYEFLNERNNE